MLPKPPWPLMSSIPELPFREFLLNLLISGIWFRTLPRSFRSFFLFLPVNFGVAPVVKRTELMTSVPLLAVKNTPHRVPPARSWRLHS